MRFILLLSLGMITSQAFGKCTYKEKDFVGLNYDEVNSRAAEANKQNCILDKGKPRIAEFKVFKVLFGMHRCAGTCSGESKEDNTLMQEACNSGFQDACFVIKSGESAKIQSTDISFAYDLCNKKSVKACEFLAVSSMAKQPAEADKYFKMACMLRSNFACSKVNKSSGEK